MQTKYDIFINNIRQLPLKSLLRFHQILPDVFALRKYIVIKNLLSRRESYHKKKAEIARILWYFNARIRDLCAGNSVKTQTHDGTLKTITKLDAYMMRNVSELSSPFRKTTTTKVSLVFIYVLFCVVFNHAIPCYA